MINFANLGPPSSCLTEAFNNRVLALFRYIIKASFVPNSRVAPFLVAAQNLALCLSCLCRQAITKKYIERRGKPRSNISIARIRKNGYPILSQIVSLYVSG
jgi:hypothetical protein